MNTCLPPVSKTRILSSPSHTVPDIRRHLLPPVKIVDSFGRHPTTCPAAASLSPSTHDTFDTVPNVKTWDVISLSNLCVDVVVKVDSLPAGDRKSRSALLDQLSTTPHAMASWEVGGNANFAIAASRLGLKTATLGCIGNDVYGEFLKDILELEGVHFLSTLAPGLAQFATLLCFVLVGPSAQHAFCSRYDFGPWPLLPLKGGLPGDAEAAIANSNSLYINGFAFDDLPSDTVIAAAKVSRDNGSAVFFDPGPRAWTFKEGDRAAALSALLDLTDVVLMTAEEATEVTGCVEPRDSARWILQRRHASTRWCFVKKGGDGALLGHRDNNGTLEFYEQAAIQVDVEDTVGCGDSFAAAVVLGYINGHELPPVMALANAVGAATATGAGAGRNVANPQTVKKLLTDQISVCQDGRHAAALDILSQSVNKG